jgi:hypothetical protein
MSYVRWSTIFNSGMSWEDERVLLQKGMPYAEIQKLKLSKPGAYKSNWYIYWHSNGGEESNKRCDQLLAIWFSGDGSHTPIMSYDQVKEMYDNDNWEALGYERFNQKEVLTDCVQRWLSDVEEECEE